MSAPWVEPETGKHRAAEAAVVRRIKFFEPLIAANEPIHFVVQDAPDDVFADAVALVTLQLVVEVMADRGRGYFGDQVGGTHDVALFVEFDLAATLRLDEKDDVGLGCRDLAEQDGAVVAGPDSRCPAR